MKPPRLKTIGYIVSGWVAGGAVAADGYPTRPVRMIVPFAPGAAQDIMGRVVAQRLTDAWGQQRSEEHTSELQ